MFSLPPLNDSSSKGLASAPSHAPCFNLSGLNLVHGRCSRGCLWLCCDCAVAVLWLCCGCRDCNFDIPHHRAHAPAGHALLAVLMLTLVRSDWALAAAGWVGLRPSGSNVQDGCVLHTDDDSPLVIGDGVTVGAPRPLAPPPPALRSSLPPDTQHNQNKQH